MAITRLPGRQIVVSDVNRCTSFRAILVSALPVDLDGACCKNYRRDVQEAQRNVQADPRNGVEVRRYGNFQRPATELIWPSPVALQGCPSAARPQQLAPRGSE